MHLSSVLQIPSVFIFGASDPNETSPYIGHFSLLINRNNPKNIYDIKVENVFAEVKKWVE
jgi:ADP-heptose:LPS heptosyltransferase